MTSTRSSGSPASGRPEDPPPAASEQPSLRPERAHQGRHVQRDSVGSPTEQLQQRLRWFAGQFEGDQVGHLIREQRSQADVDHAVRTPEQRAEPANRFDRIAAISGDDQAVVVPQTQCQVGEQVQRSRIGPMDVVDQDGQWMVCRGALEQRAH